MKAQTDGVSLIQFQRRLGSLVSSGQAPAAKTNGTAASNDTAKEDAPAVAVNTSTSSDTGDICPFVSVKGILRKGSAREKVLFRVEFF